MNESERVLNLYIKEQQEKINELTQQILMLSTRNKYLEEELNNVKSKLETHESINRKKRNEVNGFNLNLSKKQKTLVQPKP